MRASPGSVVLRSFAVGELDRALAAAGGPDAGAGDPSAVRVVDIPPSIDPAAGVEIPACEVRPGAVILDRRPWVVASVTGPELGLIHLTSVDGQRTLRVSPATPMRVRP